MSALVYIAGPYSKPDPCENTHRAIEIANSIWNLPGLVPVVPHLTHFWHTMTPKPYREWLAYDLQIMRRCDVVLRIPGDSAGADDEVADAERHGIPVVYSPAELRLWAQRRAPAGADWASNPARGGL